jgi:hypothetical protein
MVSSQQCTTSLAAMTFQAQREESIYDFTSIQLHKKSKKMLVGMWSAMNDMIEELV